MLDKLEEVGKAFRLPGDPVGYEEITVGNINSTFRVTYSNEGTQKNYVFQKINTRVFKNPKEIMENIDKVTSHIRRKNSEKPTLHFHHTDAGTNFVFDSDGGFWRVMNCIDSVTFDSCVDLDVIENTGRAFGEFQVQFSDFDGSTLNETIKDFHNTVKRLDTLFADAESDPVGRAASVEAELDWIGSVRELAGSLWREFERGAFPVRVTHNDTKSNNVLFDKDTLLPLVVIDLDTVMPGLAMYDFGDAVRFIANSAEEDEADLSKVSFDVDKFRAFCKGYIGEVKATLTPAEIDSMVLGAFAITVELASRFLDDYVMGDTYFRTKYQGHNLVRARCQIHLAKDILAKRDALEGIVKEYTE